MEHNMVLAWAAAAVDAVARKANQFGATVRDVIITIIAAG